MVIDINEAKKAFKEYVKKYNPEDEKIKLMMQFTNFLKVDIIIDNFVAQVIDFLFSKIKQPSQAEKIHQYDYSSESKGFH